MEKGYFFLADDLLSDPLRAMLKDRTLANAHLAAVVDSSDDAIISKDLNGVIQSWNAGAERLFGYPAAEAIGQPMMLVIPEDRRHEEDMILDRVRRGEKVDHFQTIRHRKDGSEVYVSVTVSPVTDSYGVIIGASKIARDDSMRVEAESANEHLAAIIASSDDAIVSKDLNGVVKTWNRGAEHLFGYLAEEMIGRSISVLLPEDRQNEEVSILERVRKGERVDHFETIRVRKDGQFVPVSVTISPIRDRFGRVVGASKVARDISERKLLESAMTAMNSELEQRVKERTAELEAVNRELEAFTYSVAHDLQGPLRSIVTNGAMAMEDYGDTIPEGAKPFLKRQTDSAQRLSFLIQDLLTYSRLGKSAMNIVEVDLSSMAASIAAEIGLPHHQMEIQEGMIVLADRSLAYILLQNLLENAHKFSPNRGEVRFGRTGATYFVQDHGIGFDMLYAEEIFDPFTRLVRQEEIPGTGIGLANAKKIVEKHNGTIRAMSVVGEGTTFYFTLGPAAESI